MTESPSTPCKAIFIEWGLLSDEVALWLRCRRPSPMLHPFAAPLSSAFESVSALATAPVPMLLMSNTTQYAQYVVLADKLMPRTS